jgi:hypothetical protein
MPRVKAYRRRDGTLVKAHTRQQSIGGFRHAIQGSLSHLKRSGGSQLDVARRDWINNATYMQTHSDGRVSLRSKAGGREMGYSGAVRKIYHLGRGNPRGDMSFVRQARKYGKHKAPLEGPFHYRSGWKGYYDSSAGRYLGMDDVYMPRDFDPGR